MDTDRRPGGGSSREADALIAATGMARVLDVRPPDLATQWMTGNLATPSPTWVTAGLAAPTT